MQSENNYADWEAMLEGKMNHKLGYGINDKREKESANIRQLIFNELK